MSSAKIVGYVAIIVGLILLVALLFTIPVWLLWNWLCPLLFGLPKITILQSFGLMLLTGFLFRSSGRGK
jgi:hypothetical protein